MPGLLDLPPELLEEIGENLTDWDFRADLASLRLSCRYVEKAIRRSFRRVRYACEGIRDPNNAGVERFCAVARIPDLAESVTSFFIHASDDGMADQGNETHPPERDHAGSMIDGPVVVRPIGFNQPVSAALLNHRSSLLAAFVALKPLEFFEFSDPYWLGPGFYQLEGDTWVSPDRPLPRHRRSPRRFIQARLVCDISSTFNFILSLIADAGLTPRIIAVHPLIGAELKTGLSNASGLVHMGPALQCVEELELYFIDDWQDSHDSAEAATDSIGQDLHDCIGNFPLLKELSLNFDSSEMGLFAWELFAWGPVFPALQQLDLHECMIFLKDFSHFILKHRNTLLRLTVYFVELEDASVNDLKDFLVTLEKSPILEDVSIVSLYLKERLVRFPSLSEAIGIDMQDEEEYVWVKMTPDDSLTLSGVEEVHEGLVTMAECVRVT